MSRRFPMHMNDIPREVTDASQQGLHAKIDEIISFLQRERDTEPPIPDTSEEIAELRRTIEDLDRQVASLKGRLLDVPEPVNVGGENLLLPPMPDATEQYQVLAANQADLADIRFDWVRAH
jgi:hypothetical protein